MAGTDMTIRILKMYEALRRGKEIQKLSFCMEHGISERTFDRDIEKIRLFLSEEYSGQEVIYSSDRECYKIPGRKEHGELSAVELVLIVKILKGDQPLERHEFEGILYSLQSVAENIWGEEALIENERKQYGEENGKSAFLKMFGDLQKCIIGRNVIRLMIKKNADSKEKIIFFPVALEYSSQEFYLLGYQSMEDEGLTVFSLEEIESFQVTLQKYAENIVRKYDYQQGRSFLNHIQEKRSGKEHEED